MQGNNMPWETTFPKPNVSSKENHYDFMSFFPSLTKQWFRFRACFLCELENSMFGFVWSCVKQITIKLTKSLNVSPMSLLCLLFPLLWIFAVGWVWNRDYAIHRWSWYCSKQRSWSKLCKDIHFPLFKYLAILIFAIRSIFPYGEVSTPSLHYASSCKKTQWQNALNLLISEIRWSAVVFF